MLKRQITLSIFLTGIIALLVTALVGGGASESRAQQSPGGFETKWNKLLKAAPKEGKVLAFICCAVGRGSKNREVFGQFEKKYGIKVINSTGRPESNGSA